MARTRTKKAVAEPENTAPDLVQQYVDRLKTPALLEFFIEATQSSKGIRLDAIPALYHGAMDALEQRYGPFPIGDVETTKSRILAISDPVLRFMAVSRVANLTWTHHVEMDRLRSDRRIAFALLRKRYGMKPKDIKRQVGVRDRRTISNAVKVAPAVELLPDWSEEDALRIAVETHAAYQAREATGEFARPLRMQLMLDLLAWRYTLDGERISDADYAAGVRGVQWSNAQISRIGDLTTARVAIARTMAV